MLGRATNPPPFAFLVAALVASTPSVAWAEDILKKPPDSSGLEHPAHDGSDTARDVAEVFLFVPRHITKFLFWSGSVAVGVLEKQPVVPRVQRFISSPGGRFAVLPTAFVDTNSTFSVGARMIADFDQVATGLRVGFGGVHSFEIEPRIAIQLDTPIRSVLGLEGLYRVDNDRIHLGVGQSPEKDARNHFRPGEGGMRARYFEERARWIASYGIRLGDDFEMALSESFTRRTVEDPRGDIAHPLSRVFEPGTVVGAFESRWMSYGEAAFRVDTRRTRGRPSGGALVETYAGAGHHVTGTRTALVRMGGRAAAFIPLYRKTNILSPRVVFDGVSPVGSLPLAFSELAGAPDFRGYDERRDNLSLVGSIDYRWLVREHFAASLFFDAQIVAPRIGAFDFGALRWVTGFAFDLHNDDATLGKLGFAAGNGGARLTFTIGVSTGYGDRQHRD